jgi:hypothetical protein
MAVFVFIVEPLICTSCLYSFVGLNTHYCIAVIAICSAALRKNATWVPPTLVRVAAGGIDAAWDPVEYRSPGEADADIAERLAAIGLVTGAEACRLQDQEGPSGSAAKPAPAAASAAKQQQPASASTSTSASASASASATSSATRPKEPQQQDMQPESSGGSAKLAVICAIVVVLAVLVKMM